MILAGQAAIEYLAGETEKTDPAASSHWRKYHAEFRFRGGRFEGLQGFGGSRPYGFARAWLHSMLQRRFRAMAGSLRSFPAVDAAARAITRRQGRIYDLDVLRQALTVAFLHEKIPDLLGRKTTACVIGDGFASLTSLLLATASAGRVILVNLTRTLLADLWYLRLWLGPETFESSVDLVTDLPALQTSLAKAPPHAAALRVIAIRAVDHELIGACSIDLALNIASMQEMDPPVVAAYFSDMRKIARRHDLTFYCCNREEKTLPDGTVVRFRDYPWRSDDRLLVDELCPWHQQYYAARPPFYRPYDGPIRHRLAQLSG